MAGLVCLIKRLIFRALIFADTDTDTDKYTDTDTDTPDTHLLRCKHIGSFVTFEVFEISCQRAHFRVGSHFGGVEPHVGYV